MKNKFYVYLTQIHLTFKVLKLWYWSDLKFVDVDAQYDSILTRLKNLAKWRGVQYAINEMKCSRLAVTRWLAGSPFKPGTHMGAPINGDGLPKVLTKEVRRELKATRSPQLIKLVMTLLSISRGVLGGAKVDLGPIETPSTMTEMPKDSEVIFALKRLKVKTQQDLSQTKVKFNWISTAGPNGVSIASSLSDLALFVSQLGQEAKILLPNISPIISKLIDWEEEISLCKLLKLTYDSSKLRKLSVKEDKEGKSRVFAIFDYWSQTCLTPLHEYLFDILRKIPNDCTFDQGAGIAKIQYPSRKWYYSYDLKSATDRFPVEFQYRVLSLMTNTDYAKAWRNMMTKIPFHYKDPDRPIKWAAGQPLGAKSSWAMFTLCHHIVVQIAAIRQGIGDAEYVILGDDIVLRGSKLAKEYQAIMTALGVEISPAKSHVSRDTFEFAKIWYSKRVNVSPFPIGGFANLIGKPIDLACLIIHELPLKGFDLLICPRSLSALIEPTLHLFPTYPRLAVYNANLLCEAIAFLKWLQERSDGWADYFCQTVRISASGSLNSLLTHSVFTKWKELVKSGMLDIQFFAMKLSRAIPSKLAFIEQEDDEMCIIGSSDGLGLQLDGHLRNIPLFDALSSEYEREDELVRRLYLFGSLPLKEELKRLELPPKPQLKGLKPIRPKTGVRAITKLTKAIKKLMVFFSHVTSTRAEIPFDKVNLIPGLMKLKLQTQAPSPTPIVNLNESPKVKVPLIAKVESTNDYLRLMLLRLKQNNQNIQLNSKRSGKAPTNNT